MFLSRNTPPPAAATLPAPQQRLNVRMIRAERLRILGNFITYLAMFAAVAVMAVIVGSVALSAISRNIPATLEQAQTMRAM